MNGHQNPSKLILKVQFRIAAKVKDNLVDSENTKGHLGDIENFVDFISYRKCQRLCL